MKKHQKRKEWNKINEIVKHNSNIFYQTQKDNIQMDIFQG